MGWLVVLFLKLLACPRLSRCVFYHILHLHEFRDQFCCFSVKSAGLLRQSNTLASFEILFFWWQSMERHCKYSCRPKIVSCKITYTLTWKKKSLFKAHRRKKSSKSVQTFRAWKKKKKGTVVWQERFTCLVPTERAGRFRRSSSTATCSHGSHQRHGGWLTKLS